ncbi:MAG: 2OG-Fe(II) oxygenase [Cyanobacteriota bacterium]|nr:2OG-Fe(II) oxygenase [Cyanobacteriota bacterium]
MSEPNWLSDEVFIVEDLFSLQECKDYIELSEFIGYEDALVTSPYGQIRRTDIRNNERVIYDDPELAEECWQRIESLVPAKMEHYWAVGVNERIRFYRYDPGQQFKWHQDGSFERDDSERSFWTFMLYLNDDFEGGETSFNDSYSNKIFKDFQVVPQTGMALFFVHSIYHQGEPVLRGRKYVLRTDVMYATYASERFG